MKTKLIANGANKDGSRIFCKLTLNGKNVVKGYYDFNKEKFMVIKYMEANFPKTMTKNKIRKTLKEELYIIYDWNL